MFARNVKMFAATILTATVLVGTLMPVLAHAQSVITSPLGQFQVGIAPNGELYDSSSGIGFLRPFPITMIRSRPASPATRGASPPAPWTGTRPRGLRCQQRRAD